MFTSWICNSWSIRLADDPDGRLDAAELSQRRFVGCSQPICLPTACTPWDWDCDCMCEIGACRAGYRPFAEQNAWLLEEFHEWSSARICVCAFFNKSDYALPLDTAGNALMPKPVLCRCQVTGGPQKQQTADCSWQRDCRPGGLELAGAPLLKGV